MNVCVFCSCSDVEQKYLDAAYNLGRALGEAGHTLVFGAFADGMMGATADGFAAAGADIIGVAPVFLEDAGRKVHEACTEVIETPNLGKRKKLMLERADAVVVAPGGIGTLDETFSVLAEIISGQHFTPVIFFDFEGFYDGLFRELEHMERDKFIRMPLADIFKSAKTVEEVAALI